MMSDKNDWPDDFKYENGNYSNTCGYCGAQFIGNKRRVNCRVCDSTQAKKPEWDFKMLTVEDYYPNGLPRTEEDYLKLEAQALEDAKTIAELQEFAIWMTGCGYDFCQHEHFCKQRDRLLLDYKHSESEEVEQAIKEST